jgi:peptide/nickel transport system substrate-binding protein
MSLFHHPRRRLAAVVAMASLVTIPVVTSACGSSTKSASKPAGVSGALAAAAPGGSVTVGESSTITSLDPTYDVGSLDQLFSIYNGLTFISQTGAVVPALAKSWSSNANATVWTFNLRSATFQNGTPVTAADVVWTYEEMMKPASLDKIYLTDIKSVKAVGTDQVVFDLSTPYAAWPREATLICILPEAYYESAGASKFAQHPIGSGPYKVTSYSPGASLGLTAYSGYWGGAPSIQHVTYQVVTSDTARTNGVQSSSLNLALIAPSQLSSVKGLSNYTVKSIPSNRVYYLGFNSTMAPMSNLDFRKAVDYGIDRAGIAKSIFSGLATPDGQVVAPVTFGHDKAIQPTPYDPTLAKSMLKSSGYSGQTIPLLYPSDGYPLISEAVQAIGAELQSLGIKVKLQATELNTYLLDWEAKKFNGIYLFAFNPSTLDAGLPLDYMYGPAGFGYFSGAQVDPLIKQQYAEPVASQREATIAKIWELTKSEELYAPLYNDDYSYAVSKDLNWTPRPDGLLLLATATLK